MNGKFIAFFSVLSAALICLIIPPSRTAFSNDEVAPIIVIDAGHGGLDGGAVGISGVEEKGLNLEIAKKLRATLGFLGYDTLMTRDGDNFITNDGGTIRERKVSDIKARVELVNNTKNPYLISVHLNHFQDDKCYGAQVFYTNDDSAKTVAEHIQDAMRQGVNKNNKRVAKEIGKNIYIMNHINCPGVLIECGFLSNPSEEQLLQTEDYQKIIAMSVAVGFADGYKEVKKYEN